VAPSTRARRTSLPTQPVREDTETTTEEADKQMLDTTTKELPHSSGITYTISSPTQELAEKHQLRTSITIAEAEDHDISETEEQRSTRIIIEYGLTICVNFQKISVIHGILFY